MNILKKVMIGFGALMAFAACSNDEPEINSSITDDTSGEQYMSVTISMPNSIGGRAAGVGDNEADKFQDGTQQESAITSMLVFFFDAVDRCIDVRKIDNPVFEGTGTPVDPAVTTYGTCEIRLKSGLDYKQVAVALNLTSAASTYLVANVNNFQDLKNYGADFVENIMNDGSKQPMSNTVYFKEENASTKPSAKNLFVLVPITDDNIYTSAEKAALKDKLFAEGNKEYVDIYVERVAARVNVSQPSIDYDSYYIYKNEDGSTVKTITLFDPNDMNKNREIRVAPVIEGMDLNVLTPSANLLKNVTVFPVGYNNSGTNAWDKFQWNDPANKRCYWANTPLESEASLIYKSWDDAVSRGKSALKKYIHPNTNDYAPTEANEANSNNSKLMVVARLYEVDEDGKPVSATPLELIRYGADYMLASSLNVVAANMLNTVVVNMDLSGQVDDSELDAAKVAISKVDFTKLTNAFELVQVNVSAGNKPVDNSWEVRLDYIGASDYGISTENAELKAKLVNILKEQVDNTMASINHQTIMYWKGGRTYFYIPIYHQGFVGLAGTGTSDHLNGVIRNHIYEINVTGFYGLGTPVVNPTEPIDPERPGNEVPSFMSVKINVLKWRVVKQNATLH